MKPMAMIAVLSSGLVVLAPAAAGSESTIYDPDPKHLWNRLNETLFTRTAPD